MEMKKPQLTDRLMELAALLADGIASLPYHLGVLLLIIFLVAGPPLMTPEQIEHIKDPFINGATVAALYLFGVLTTRFLRFRNVRFPYDTAAGPVAYGISLSRELLPEPEFHRAAIHEAGHLLALALFPATPTSIHAYVRHYHSTPTGNVRYEFSVPLDASYSWAHMLNALAGQVAENVVSGNVRHGSENDNTTWERLAKRHLRAGFSHDRPWFITPETEAEATLNARTLEIMRSEQVQQLTSFFMANRSRLETTAVKLKEVDAVDTEEGLLLLAAVTIPR